MSRSDFILRSDGELIFLETNSIPGLTERALLPQAAAAAGIDFTAMISRLVESALR
jgi:D-alanine-D-alanine ligase